MNVTAKKWLGRVGGFFLILVDILGVLVLAAFVETEYSNQLGAAV